MNDKREAILVRMLGVLTAIPPQLGYDQHIVARNRGEFPEAKRPALVLLDGLEEQNPNFLTDNRGRQFMSPSIMTLRPQIFVLLKARERVDNEGVGTELNTFRAAIVKALATDSALAALVGANGDISLKRVETDMQTGSTLQGQMRMDFWINYVFDPYAI